MKTTLAVVTLLIVLVVGGICIAAHYDKSYEELCQWAMKITIGLVGAGAASVLAFGRPGQS